MRRHSAKPTTLSERIIADHVRAATFCIADGVLPSNEGRGYVLRRLIRRAAVHARRVELRVDLSTAVGIAVGIYSQHYTELVGMQPAITEAVKAESDRFQRTIEQGMEQFEKVVARYKQAIPGDEAFKLHDTFGFPLELTRELADERGLEVDEEGFRAAMAAQRERSRGTIAQHWVAVKDLPRSDFTGYNELSTSSKVVALRSGGRAV